MPLCDDVGRDVTFALVLILNLDTCTLYLYLFMGGFERSLCRGLQLKWRILFIEASLIQRSDHFIARENSCSLVVDHRPC